MKRKYLKRPLARTVLIFSMAADAGGSAAGAVFGVLAGIFLLYTLSKAFLVVREKQQIVLERCGRFKSVLTPGIHCILPYIDA